MDIPLIVVEHKHGPDENIIDWNLEIIISGYCCSEFGATTPWERRRSFLLKLRGSEQPLI